MNMNQISFGYYFQCETLMILISTIITLQTSDRIRWGQSVHTVQSTSSNK